MSEFERDAPRGRDEPRERVMRVLELNRLAKLALEEGFPDVWVEGELSDVVRAASGHVYFMLNDGQDPAQVRGVMFRSDVRRSRARFADGEKVRTSTLRYLFEEVLPRTAVPIEPLDPALFHLNNQYWVSYYHGARIFDKKYIFVPDSIVEANFTHIALLDQAGVLHS